MKTLYLLRHAHTFEASPPLMGDYERILSPQGTEEALAIGQFMQEHDIYPDFALSSSAVRAIQTVRLIFGTLFRKAGVRVSSHFDRLLYQAPAATILSEIRKTDNSINRLLVVGHNPGVGELAQTLTHGKVNSYSPGTLTIFNLDCEGWAGLSPQTAKFDRVFIPQTKTAYF